MKYHTSDGSALTPAQLDRLDEIEQRADASVDVPPAPEANWASAVRGKHARAVGGMIPLCLDPDVQAWLRAKGPCYQADGNRRLRERMQAEG